VNTLQVFAEDIWIADGAIVRAYGFPFNTRMILVRLRNGDLWINSPVEASADEMNRVEEIGPVKHLVSPTPMHDWRLAGWSTHFPAAKVWRADELGDDAPDEWSSDLDQAVLRGSRVLNEVEFLHRRSRTLIFGDFIQKYPPRPGKHALNTFLKFLVPANGGVPIDIRLSFTGKKRVGRESLERVLQWDFDRVILAHGPALDHDAKAFVRNAFSWLSG